MNPLKNITFEQASDIVRTLNELGYTTYFKNGTIVMEDMIYLKINNWGKVG